MASWSIVCWGRYIFLEHRDPSIVTKSPTWWWCISHDSESLQSVFQLSLSLFLICQKEYNRYCQAGMFSAISLQIEKNLNSNEWNLELQHSETEKILSYSKSLYSGLEHFSQTIHNLPGSNPLKIAFTQLLFRKNILGSKWPILRVRDTRNQCEKSGHMVISEDLAFQSAAHVAATFEQRFSEHLV